MKRLALIIASFCLFGAALSATTIRSVDTEVYLHKNASAVVYQRWMSPSPAAPNGISP